MGETRNDRVRTPYSLTRSVCPICLEMIDATLSIDAGRLIMRKHCREHGWFEALVSSDAGQYHSQRRFNRPGTLPVKFEREYQGCPESCGLCPEHQQHTCLGIIEVTDACNLRCPVCFANARQGHQHLPLAEIERMLERLRQCEGDPEVVQLSGGEPTLHPEILDILALVRKMGYRKILLNTNGLRLAEDPEFAARLVETDPTIYLQFDGFDGRSYELLRGRDLASIKQKIVDQLAQLGLRIVLVATIVRGINEHELGPLVDFALEQDHIRCLNLQPATFSGRFEPANSQSLNPGDRITLSELTGRIAEQSRYGLRLDDFFPIPCPDPACSRVTYIHKKGDTVRAIPRLVDIEDYLDYVKNASVPQLTDKIRQALESLFSMSAVPGEDTTRSFCQACGVQIDWGDLEREITMISMMHFMDAHDFDLNRARKCCVHEVLPYEGGIVPFCNYNIFRRGRG